MIFHKAQAKTQSATVSIPIEPSPDSNSPVAALQRLCGLHRGMLTIHLLYSRQCLWAQHQIHINLEIAHRLRRLRNEMSIPAKWPKVIPVPVA